MLTLECRVDNVVNKEGGRNSKTGEFYEPYQIAQITYWETSKNGESVMQRVDLTLPRAWGDMKGLKGQTVSFPVTVAAINWDMNFKIPEGSAKPIIKGVISREEGAPGNGKQSVGARSSK